MLHKPHICTLLFLLCSALLFGQENDFLRGTVIDQKTGEPVIFATIQIKGKAKGVITNMDGGFRLPNRFKVEGESIIVSSLGYQKKEISFFELSSISLNIIRLVPGALELTEAIVSAKKKPEPSARKIVRRAIQNIPLNFLTTNFSTTGYYRDYQLDSLGYLNLNEAILEVFDEGFDELDMEKSKTRIFSYNQNKSFRRDSLADNPYNYEDYGKIMNKAYLPAYGGNEFVLLRVHNPIRNFKINSFDFINNMYNRDILRNHGFEKRLETFTDEENLYTIDIKKTTVDFTARGTIFIAKNDYAIHKLRYAVYDETKESTTARAKEVGNKNKLVFEITVEYKRGQKDKMYLNYISFHNTFSLAEPPKFAVKDLTILPDLGAFAIRFNNALAYSGERFGRSYGRVGEAKADSRRWYNFKYDDKKIQFKNIEIKDERTVYLYPKMDEITLKNMMNQLVALNKEKLDIGRVLKFKVSGLEDVDGNSLNTRKYRTLNQFREYFVQEVDVQPQIPLDSLLMDKYKPIFEEQPIFPPANFNDYWMNTPLQKSQ